MLNCASTNTVSSDGLPDAKKHLIYSKKKLTSAPVLKQPDVRKPFAIESDVSEWAIGCALIQQDDEEKWHPVAYDGQKLNAAEINYPIHDKELLAIKHALCTWYMYVDNGFRTAVLTDHESLKYFQTTQKPSKRLARWISEFSEYDLDIRYCKCSEAIVPDAISRQAGFMGATPGNLASALNLLLRGTDEQERYKAMVKHLRDGTVPHVHLCKTITDQAHQFRITNGDKVDDSQLYRVFDGGEAPYLEQPFRADFIEHMLKEYGHLGVPGLYGVIKFRAWWHSIGNEKRKYINYVRNTRYHSTSARDKKRNNRSRWTQIAYNPSSDGPSTSLEFYPLHLFALNG
jgi:hypothetical protein